MNNRCETYFNFQNVSFGVFTVVESNTFKQNANFSNTLFTGAVQLSGNKFNGTTHFDHVQFNTTLLTDLSRNNFNKDAHFDFCHFSRFADLSYANCGNNGNLIFFHCQLLDTLNFSNVSSFNSVIDLGKAEFYKNGEYDSIKNAFKIHYINLRNSTISKIKLDYVHFRLVFNTGKKNDQSAEEDKQTTYRQLLKNFDDHEQVESFKNLDVEYHFFLFDKVRLPWVGTFFYYWREYGYAKERIFSWTLSFIFIFTIIDFRLINFLNQEVYQMDNIPNLKQIGYFRVSHHRLLIERTCKIHRCHLPGLEFAHFRNRLWYAFVYTRSIFLG